MYSRIFFFFYAVCLGETQPQKKKNIEKIHIFE